MRVSIIVAMATNGVIGRGGKLPWRLSDDLRRFKRLTMGHTIVMGRRTWESIGRPLPGRRTIIVSRRLQFGSDAEDVAVAASFDEALRIAESAGGDEAFIVGGSQLYREALPRADRLHITRVLACIEGDTYFPNFDQSEWRIVSSQHHASDSVNEFPCEFETYERLRIV